MHLSTDNTLSSTHSVAESIDAIYSEHAREGAYSVLVEWDSERTTVYANAFPADPFLRPLAAPLAVIGRILGCR